MTLTEENMKQNVFFFAKKTKNTTTESEQVFPIDLRKHELSEQYFIKNSP